MNNEELKIKYNKVNQEISLGKLNNKDITDLLKIKYELLKIGFFKIKDNTISSEFDNNPKKYSTLLSYINMMKEISNEISSFNTEISHLEEGVIAEMKKNKLEWLLDK